MKKRFWLAPLIFLGFSLGSEISLATEEYIPDTKAQVHKPGVPNAPIQTITPSAAGTGGVGYNSLFINWVPNLSFEPLTANGVAQTAYRNNISIKTDSGDDWGSLPPFIQVTHDATKNSDFSGNWQLSLKASPLKAEGSDQVPDVHINFGEADLQENGSLSKKIDFRTRDFNLNNEPFVLLSSKDIEGSSDGVFTLVFNGPKGDTGLNLYLKGGFFSKDSLDYTSQVTWLYEITP